MRLTKIQWITVLLILAYLVYEFYFVAKWAAQLPESDPVIRADLVFIWPVLFVLIIISVVQLIRKKD
jgi:hypothetical protein